MRQLMTGWLPIIIVSASSALSAIALLITTFRLQRNKHLRAGLAGLANDIEERDQSLRDSRAEIGKLEGQLLKASTALESKAREYSEVSEFLRTCESERDKAVHERIEAIQQAQSLRTELEASQAMADADRADVSQSDQEIS